MKIEYHGLEKKLKINFKNKDLLIKSLTHKSFNKNNNEKIEFLGDRVLGLVIAKKLLEIYPDEKEGVLDKKFANLVNKKRLFIKSAVVAADYSSVRQPHNKLESSIQLEPNIDASFLNEEYFTYFFQSVE